MPDLATATDDYLTYLRVERGLAPALEVIAARCEVPVELSADLDDRLPKPVEAAAYYVVVLNDYLF